MTCRQQCWDVANQPQRFVVLWGERLCRHIVRLTPCRLTHLTKPSPAHMSLSNLLYPAECDDGRKLIPGLLGHVISSKT